MAFAAFGQGIGIMRRDAVFGTAGIADYYLGGVLIHFPVSSYIIP